MQIVTVQSKYRLKIVFGFQRGKGGGYEPTIPPFAYGWGLR